MLRSLPIASIMVSLASGCVADDGPAFFVSGAVAPDDMCVYAVDNERVARGVFNAQFGFAYNIAPVLNSQLVSRGGTAPLRADPNNILITGAVVELQDARGDPIDFGGALPNPFTVAVSAYVPSTLGNLPSEEVGAIQAIPPAYATALDGQLGSDPFAVKVVLVVVEMFGETVGGVDIEAAPWTWPVDVCHADCLYDCVAAGTAVDDTANTCTCGQDAVCPRPIGTPPC